MRILRLDEPMDPALPLTVYGIDSLASIKAASNRLSVAALEGQHPL